MSGPLTFQETILRLEAFWAARALHGEFIG